MTEHGRRGISIGLFLNVAAAVGLLVALRAVSDLELPRPGALLALEPIPREGLGLSWSRHAIWPVDLQLAAMDRLVATLAALVGAAAFVAALNGLVLLAETSVARRQELAVRAALGARPGQLLGMLLVELRTLGAAALALGLLAGMGGGTVARALWPGAVLLEVGWRQAAGSLLLPLAAIALLLAWAHVGIGLRVSSGPAAGDQLKVGARATSDAVGVFFRRAAGAAHVAIAGAVVVSGLALAAWALPPAAWSGEPGGAMVITGIAPSAGAWTDLLDELDRVAELDAESLAAPGALVGLGVRDYVLAECGVCEAAQCGDCDRGGIPLPFKGALVDHHAVTPAFFAQTGATLLAGRLFTDADDADGKPVAIVNEVFARSSFEYGQAVGKRVKVGEGFGTWVSVVGIVEASRTAVPGQDELPREMIFLSARQHPPRSGSLVLNGTAEAVRGVVVRMHDLGFAPGVPVALSTHRARLAAPLGWLGRVTALVALLALVVAVYGVHITALQVTRRRAPELALRRALGAGDRRVFRHVLAERMTVGLWGVAGMVFFGTLAVALLRRATGVPALGPTTYLGVATLLLLVAVLGSIQAGREALEREPAELLE